MRLWNRLTGGGIGTIDWDGASPDGLLVRRFTRDGNDIRTGATLVVRDGWAAALVCGGTVADVCPPGTYPLDAASVVALLGDKAKWSPSRATFNVDVFYVSLRAWAGLPWALRNLPPGLSGPGQRVSLQGTCGFRVANPGAFLGELLKPNVALEDYPAANLRNVIAVRFGDWLRAKQLTSGDLSSDGERLVGRARARIAADLGRMGVELTEFLVAGVGGFAGYSHAAPKPTNGTGPVGDTPAPPETRSMAATDTPPETDSLAESAIPPAGPASIRIPLAEPPPDSGRMLLPSRPASPPSGRILLPDPDSDPDMTASPFPLLRGWGAGPVSGRMSMQDGPPPLAGEPPPVAVVYHVALNGAPAGPFDLATVTAKIRGGEISPTSLVWRKGLKGWIPAATVPELGGEFDAAPPPLPPG